MSDERAEEQFFILSMERSTDAKSCAWWMPNGAGYTTSIAKAGRYSRDEAARQSDPPYHLAVPCHLVEVPASRAKDFAKKALREGRFDPPKRIIATPAPRRASAKDTRGPCANCGKPVGLDDACLNPSCVLGALNLKART